MGKKSTLGILVMAAGKGTRMKSGLPKVLLPVLDKPMLGYLLETVLNCEPDGVAVLVGHKGEQVCDYLKRFPSVEPLWQREQLGTGHAVQVTREWWERFSRLLVLNGDLPCLGLSTLRSFLNEHFNAQAACSLLSFVTERPEGYGRVIRGSDGKISIVEHKDASPRQLLIKEVNAGCYIFDVQQLSWVIGRLGNGNAQGEYYLPDVAALMSEAGLKVHASAAKKSETERKTEGGTGETEGTKGTEEMEKTGEMLGVNTQAELAAITERMRKALVERWMAEGVRVMDPSAVWIGPDVELAPGVSLMPGAQIWGNSVIGEGSVVGPYCILRNARLGRRVNLIAHVVVEDSTLCDDARAGPFAYIREHSFLSERAFAGKFVEIKKTTVGQGSKIPHLSYMGDAVLGENVNIGAGSVTCNYDGKNKFPTAIGDRCFVGSDTMMVAPVVLGDDAATAAGSVITADVPAGALGVGRARQKNIEGWMFKKKQMEK